MMDAITKILGAVVGVVLGLAFCVALIYASRWLVRMDLFTPQPYRPDPARYDYSPSEMWGKQ